MNYTPGPWKLEEDDHKCVAVASSADSRFPHFRICRVWRTRKGSHLQDIGEANARLIAAAPDLLEALEDACLSHAAFGDQPPEKWLAAIEKAKGK